MCKDSNDTVAREPYLSTLGLTPAAGYEFILYPRFQNRRRLAKVVPGWKDSVRERPNHSSLNAQNSVKFLSKFSKFW